MSRFIALLLVLLCSRFASAGIINMEFKFTPYLGDPAKADQVEVVAGKASVFINNVPLAVQELQRSQVPVLFEEREISAAVWVPASSMGAALRKGKNIIRFEFEPVDMKIPYQARLAWLSVSDQTTESSDGNRFSATNQTGPGQEDRPATGKVVLQREFTADFATELAWHHYPAVTALSDEDRRGLAQMLKSRGEAFKPPFSGVFQLLQNNRNMNLQELKKAACLDKAHAAGVRIAIPASDQLTFTITGNPEVVITRKDGAPLFYPLEMESFERIKDEEARMCAAMALAMAYPQRLVVVRKPSGGWEEAY